MTSNAELLDWLFARGAIDLRRGESLDRRPVQLPATFDWDRIDGMMLGLAIGDALGNTTESMLPARRREVCGEIRDYAARLDAGPIGSPSPMSSWPRLNSSTRSPASSVTVISLRWRRLASLAPVSPRSPNCSPASSTDSPWSA